MTVPYHSIDEIEEVVRGFESCGTDKEDFTHARHLTVAAWYLTRHPFEQAAEKMRSGLFHFLDHHEVPGEKYNETITLFWLKVVNAFVIGQRGTSSSARKGPTLTNEQMLSLVNQLIQVFQDTRLVFEYYSESLLRSPAAKSGWVEPDLKQF